jgi:hypothetical protein
MPSNLEKLSIISLSIIHSFPAILPVLLYLYDICFPERFTALNFYYEDTIALPEAI